MTMLLLFSLTVLFYATETVEPFKTFISEVERCRWTDIGYEYIGKVDYSSSGKKCAVWTSRGLEGYVFPEGSVKLAENFCRNPDLDPKGPWCFDEAGEKMYCEISKCTSNWNDCIDSTSGYEYHGERGDLLTGGQCSEPCRASSSNYDSPVCNSMATKPNCSIPTCVPIDSLSRMMNIPDHYFGMESYYQVKEFKNYRNKYTMYVRISLDKSLATPSNIARLHVLSTNYKAACQPDFNYHHFCQRMPSHTSHNTSTLVFSCSGIIRSVTVISSLPTSSYSFQYMLNLSKNPEVISLQHEIYIKTANQILSSINDQDTKTFEGPKNSGWFEIIQNNTIPVIIDGYGYVFGTVSFIGSTLVGFIANDQMGDNNWAAYRHMFKLIYGDYSIKPKVLTEDSIETLRQSGKFDDFYVWSVHKTIHKDSLDKLVDLIKNGLKLIVGMKPWAYNHYTENIRTSYIRRLYVEAGIWPNLGYGSNSLRAINKITDELLPLSVALDYAAANENNALKVQKIFAKFPSKSVNLGDLYPSHLNSLSLSTALYYNSYSSYVKSIMPCFKESTMHDVEKAVFSIMNFVLLNNMGNRFADVPGSNIFPGYGNWKENNMVIKIDTAMVFNYESYILGVYVKPNSDFSIRIKTKSSANCVVKINVMFLDMSQKPSWLRYPNVEENYEINNDTDYRFYSRFGGILSINCASNEEVAQVTMSKVYQLAMYDVVNGIDNVNQFKDQSPWFIFGTKFLIFIFPITTTRNIDDFEPFVNLYDSIMLGYLTMRGWPIKRRREMIVADVQTAAGYMHSGYPIGTPMYYTGNPSKRDEYVFAMENIEWNGRWGLLHELGHNMQSNFVMTPCFGDVFNNIFTVLGQEIMTRKNSWTPGEGWLYHPRDKNIENYINTGEFNNNWCNRNHFVALGTFVQLSNEFGWEFYRELFKRFNEMETSKVVIDDKIGMWIVEMSRVAKVNLIGFFEFWKWPITDETTRQVNSQGHKYYYLPDDWLTQKFPEKVDSIKKKYGGGGKFVQKYDPVHKSNFYENVIHEFWRFPKTKTILKVQTF